MTSSSWCTSTSDGRWTAAAVFAFCLFIYDFLFFISRLYPIDKSRSVEGGGPGETKKVVNETSEARNEGEKKKEEEETKKDK